MFVCASDVTSDTIVCWYMSRCECTEKNCASVSFFAIVFFDPLPPPHPDPHVQTRHAQTCPPHRRHSFMNQHSHLLIHFVKKMQYFE